MTTSPDLPARPGTGPQAGAPTQVADLPAHPGTGLLISVEGGDGVGKTTQIGLLEAVLKEAGVEYVLTREPGGTELGASIRRLLLHGGYVSPRAEALLYAADRAHHVATCILPALERGAVVLTDRYLDSSVAYQGAARALGPQEVRDLSLWATGSLLPDLTVLLDADPALTVRRARERGLGDRIEQESDSFRATLRREFLDLAAAEPHRFVVVDAAQGIEAVGRQVSAAVLPLLRERLAQGRLARRGSAGRPDRQGTDRLARQGTEQLAQRAQEVGQ